MRHTHLGEAIKDPGSRSPGPAHGSPHSAPGRGENALRPPRLRCAHLSWTAGVLPPPDRGAEAARAAAGLGAHGCSGAGCGQELFQNKWEMGAQGGLASLRPPPRRGSPLPAHPAFPAKVGRAAGSRPAPGPARKKSPGGGEGLKKAQGSHQPSPRSHLHGTKGFCVGQGGSGRVRF